MNSEQMFEAMPKTGHWITLGSKTDTALGILLNTITMILLLASPAILLGIYRLAL